MRLGTQKSILQVKSSSSLTYQGIVSAQIRVTKRLRISVTLSALVPINWMPFRRSSQEVIHSAGRADKIATGIDRESKDEDDNIDEGGVGVIGQKRGLYQ